MGKSHKKLMRSLSVRVALVVATVVFVSAAAYLAWSQHDRAKTIENSVLAEARTLNTEMQAAWDYIDGQQDSINYNADGKFDFKGVYCSVAGKGIAKRFTRQSEGYVIRYVRENPRSGTDVPDSFEAEALRRFASGEATEYHEMTTFEGIPAFRYASMLTIKRNCLECHGEPAGEHDITGFIKEGMRMGDVAGAVSMVIPVDAYEREASADMVRSLVFFLLLAIAIALAISLALRRWVASPLERANEQLQSENEEKSNFLAIMSHELRTPLASIIAFADIWEKSVREKDLDEIRLVKEIKENGVTLLNMVNNTIDVARLEAGKFEVQYDDVDLVDVVNAVFSVAEPLAMKQGIVLTKAVDPKIPIIWSDWEALRKVVLNLVSNALKYTDEGGSVHVGALMGVRADVVVLTVSDTGVGIAPEDFGRIFSRFAQAGAAGSPSEGGSGLGLFLVKGLVEKLGGTVSVKSVVGEGSTFTVTLPLVCPDEDSESDVGRLD